MLSLLGLTLSIALPACGRRSGPKPAAPDNSSLIVAQVGDQTILASQLEQIVSRLPAASRALYRTGETRRKLLDDLVHTTILALEAQRRGYDKDPEVLRLAQQAMASRMLEDELAKRGPLQPSIQEIEKYLAAHEEERQLEEEIQIAAIVVGDATKAKQVAREAHEARQADPIADQATFRSLVARYSEDRVAKERGGVLPFVTRRSPLVPAALIEAGFSLSEVGATSPPIRTPAGFHILKLLHRRPAMQRPVPDARARAQERLYREKRSVATEEFYTELRRSTPVVVHEDVLSTASLGK
jgi:peptidyl-prolyl cis-trans isomerase C